MPVITIATEQRQGNAHCHNIVVFACERSEIKYPGLACSILREHDQVMFTICPFAIRVRCSNTFACLSMPSAASTIWPFRLVCIIFRSRMHGVWAPYTKQTLPNRLEIVFGVSERCIVCDIGCGVCPFQWFNPFGA